MRLAITFLCLSFILKNIVHAQEATTVIMGGAGGAMIGSTIHSAQMSAKAAAAAAGGDQQLSDGYKGPCSKADSSAWACPLVVGFAGAGVIAIATAADSQDKAGQLGGSGKNWGDGLPDVEINGTTFTAAQLRQNLENNINALKPKGYDFDPKTNTIKTPKGKFPMSALQNGASMAKAGLIPPTEIEVVDEAMKKANEAVMKSKISVAQGGGGGAAGGRKPSSAGSDFNFNFGAGMGGGEKPNAPKTSGLSVLVGGQPVGASTGSLFGQIAEAYKKKRERGEFIAGDDKNK